MCTSVHQVCTSVHLWCLLAIALCHNSGDVGHPLSLSQERELVSSTPCLEENIGLCNEDYVLQSASRLISAVRGNRGDERSFVHYVFQLQNLSQIQVVTTVSNA